MDNRESELDVETDHQDILMAGTPVEGLWVTPLNHGVTDPRRKAGDCVDQSVFKILMAVRFSQEAGEEVVQGVHGCSVHRSTHEDLHPGT